MAGAYAKSDWRVVDYELYSLDPPIIDPVTGTPLELRGPRPPTLNEREYFVCIGGAQTFGRFCARPYPVLLQERLGIPAVNLGRGGAGPSFFAPGNDGLLYHVNRSRFAIVQVMSGRSASNSLFSSAGLGSYVRLSDGKALGCDEAFDRLLRHHTVDYVRRIVAETRQAWLDSFKALLRAITVPKILCWFAMRPPRYREKYRSVASLFGDFPQLVNADMMNELRQYADHYVVCVSRRGLPQPLIDKRSGEPVTVHDEWGGVWRQNGYYPSPEMHVDAANRLEAICAACVAGSSHVGRGTVRTIFAWVRQRARAGLKPAPLRTRKVS